METAQQTPADRLRLAELLAALSVVTDLGIGRPPDTAMHACWLATRLAETAGVDGDTRRDIYYTTLLRYIGCTAYAHEEMAMWGGESWEVRNVATSIDWSNGRQAMSFVVTQAGRGHDPLRRAGLALAALPRTIRANSDLVAAHCEVGGMMARRLGMSPAVQQGVQQIFERWDGKGWPSHLQGEQLGLPIRFAQVATQAMAQVGLGGIEGACAAVSERAGGALDPEVARIFLECGPAWWQEAGDVDVWEMAVSAEPQPRQHIPKWELDGLARAFADMADLQVTFTRGHSSGVAALAEAAARALGFADADVTSIRRAALFHDIGRVGVSNRTWEKSGPLTRWDWEQIRLHPYHTERILSRAPVLASLAAPASMHHERQDGSGYFRSIAGPAIPLAGRIIAAADAYQAMTQERPHRPARRDSEAAAELRSEAEAGRLDAEAVRAVLEAAGHPASRRAAEWPAGLSDREVEVLRLIARGHSYKDVARDLVISPRTAAHHVQHIYDKIGVSTRASAAMFAMEHDLLPR